jgi:5-methylthioadenosine/S-adenosylhomocysteine deaminase
MPVVAADLCIEVRWTVPMTVRNEVLEEHSVLIRDGRILDILPTVQARERYAASVVLQRPSHLIMPGLINTQADAALSLLRGRGRNAADGVHGIGTELARDGVLLAIAEMLKSGITCFCDRYFFPEETARTASEQGMRAVLGMPVVETATPWATGGAQSLTRALQLRDEYRGHPLVSTAFAPHDLNRLSDATFSRLHTLADELDAGIMLDLHRSAAAVNACMTQHGVRPIERLWKLGLLTPALNAVHMSVVTAADIALAQRTGISVSLCPLASVREGNPAPPTRAYAAAGIRLGLGSAGMASRTQDLWGEIRLLAVDDWEALRIATHGGAAVLGIDIDVGTLEPGKWADVCCLDLSGPATQPAGDPLAQIAINGGRDLVKDVWVAGRQLLSEGELTRLDWIELATRCHADVAAYGRRAAAP